MADPAGVERLDADGHFDRSYGFSFLALDGEVSAAGRLVVPGSVRGAPALSRRLKSGRPDPAFGAAGITRFALPSGLEGVLFAVRLRADGGVIGAGIATRRGDSKAVATLVVRADDRGVPDESFGPGGVRVLPRTVGLPAALDGDAGAFLVVARADGGGAVLSRRLAGGSLDEEFGTSGRVRLPGADAVAAPPRAGSRVVVAWAEPKTGTVTLAALSRSGTLDAAFGKGGVVRVGLGASATGMSITASPEGGVVLVAGIRGALAAVAFDRFGKPERSFGASGAACVPFEGPTDDGLVAAFSAQAAASPAGLTVAWTTEQGEPGVMTIARMRWRAPRALTCTSAVQRGDAIRFSGVRSRTGRLELVLRRPGRGGRPGRLVATVRFATRAAGARADLWNRHLHGRRVPCQALIATPRLVSPGGRILGGDAPLPLYPNCPGADV